MTAREQARVLNEAEPERPSPSKVKPNDRIGPPTREIVSSIQRKLHGETGELILQNFGKNQRIRLEGKGHIYLLCLIFPRWIPPASAAAVLGIKRIQIATEGHFPSIAKDTE